MLFLFVLFFLSQSLPPFKINISKKTHKVNILVLHLLSLCDIIISQRNERK
nr:MAG TPA: hypothetical protein [Caudoviricetes sp.]